MTDDGFIDLDLDLRDVEDGFRGISLKSKELRPVFSAVQKDLREDIREHFARTLAEEGPWPGWSRATMDRFLAERKSVGPGPYSPAYRRRVHAKLANVKRSGALTKRAERRTHNLLGRLKIALGLKIERTYIEARNLVAWAGAHEFGGTVGHGATLPQRSFMWASEGLVDHFRDLLLAHVLKGWDQ